MINNENLISLLQATLNPALRDEAESELKKLSITSGFSSMLLQIVVSETYKMPVRQAAAIYFKNFISKNWNHLELPLYSDAKLNTTIFIPDHDKTIIKDNIIEAVIHSPEIIRSQLALSINSMIKYDYPEKWPKLLVKLENFIKDNSLDISLGGLICFHCLIKIYEYKKPKDRIPLYNALSQLLPFLCQKFQMLLNDNSEKSVVIQKTIFKSFYAAIQQQLPTILMNHEFFASWMQIFLTSFKMPIPQFVNELEEDERMSSIWWKCKKWIVHILCRIFERYGLPVLVSKDYKEFAIYYMNTYTTPVLEALLITLDSYRQNQYVSPRVIHYCFTYLTECVEQSFTWKQLKPHLQVIVHEIILKLLMFTEEDQNVWDNDPIEYIRTKFDIYEDFGSPVTAAKDFLFAICTKRQGILQEVANFVVNSTQNTQAELQKITSAGGTPKEEYALKCRQLDALLVMLGTLSDALIFNLKGHHPAPDGDSNMVQTLEDNVDYKPLIYILMNLVLPLTSNHFGFIRARACWVLNQFKKIKLDQSSMLTIVNVLKELLLKDPELPVKAEAAVALKSYIKQDSKAKDALSPNLKEVISELLNILKQTLNEEMTVILKRMLCIYGDQVKPLILEMLNHIYSILAATEAKKEDEEVRMFLGGLLDIVETLVELLDENKDSLVAITDPVLQIINLILNKFQADDCPEDFYDEILSLSNAITAHVITPNAWSLLQILYGIFLKDKESFFTEIAPVYYNFMTVDKAAFQSDPARLQLIFGSCKEILDGYYTDESMEMHALKLIEVLLIDYPNFHEQLIPVSLELVFKRLFRSMHIKEAKAFEDANKPLQQQPVSAPTPLNSNTPSNSLHENVSSEDGDDEDKYVMTPTCESMNIQIVFVCLFFNPQSTLQQLANLYQTYCIKYQIPPDNVPPPAGFLSELLNKAMANSEFLPGIHDNKMFVLGVCTLLNLPIEIRRQIRYFVENPKLLPNLLVVLDVIRRHRKARTHDEGNSWEDDEASFNSSDEDFEYPVPIVDEEDFQDESKRNYLQAVSPSGDDKKGTTSTDAAETVFNRLGDMPASAAEGAIEDECDEEEEYEDFDGEEEDEDEYGLEAYTCSIDEKASPVDEFTLFRDSVQNLQHSDPEYYTFLTTKLKKSEVTRLKEVFMYTENQQKLKAIHPQKNS